MPDSREWTATLALQTRLQDITAANGFETDVQVVELIDRFPDVVREYPAILFAPASSDRPDNEKLRRIDQRLRFDLALLLETWEDGPRKISNFIADVEKALTTDSSGNIDTTLGGATKDLHVRSDSRFQIDSEGGPRAAAVVRIEMVVRHRTGDPYTAGG
jgi:hypothetical protein